MFFKSFYTRIIFILATMSLALFIILAFINTIVFRNEFLKLWTKLEHPRIQQLFHNLDQSFDEHYSPDEVKAKIDSMYFEFNIDLFDKSGNWITGSYSYLKKLVIADGSKTLEEKDHFTSFEKIYYNPNRNSPFHAVKIKLSFINSPIISHVFFYFLLSGIFVIIVSAVVGWRLVYYLNKRLNRLKKGVTKVARGEFDIELEVEGTDEIAFLARNFNYMSSQIKKLVHRLEESNAARQRLIAHASHEIKSPLTSIKGFIDILEFMDVMSDEQQKNLLPVVKKDLNRVVKITNDMLQLAQIRDPEYTLQIKSINFQEFLLEEHSYFAHKAAINQVTAIYDCKIVEPIQLSADTERLSQIFDNLWNNALKYGDRSHPIHTYVFVEGNQVGIKIANHLKNKIDVPLQRLFEPFYRHPSSAEKESGSGLGLAIVKELTEKMNGRIVTHLTDEVIEITLYFDIVTPPHKGRSKRDFLDVLKKKKKSK